MESPSLPTAETLRGKSDTPVGPTPCRVWNPPDLDRPTDRPEAQLPDPAEIPKLSNESAKICPHPKLSPRQLSPATDPSRPATAELPLARALLQS